MRFMEKHKHLIAMDVPDAREQGGDEGDDCAQAQSQQNQYQQPVCVTVSGEFFNDQR